MDITPQQKIKSALALQDVTVTDIARAVGVSRCAVSMVIHGRMRSARIEKRLEEMVGEKIFSPVTRRPWAEKRGHAQKEPGRE